jgi:hypothetical protein
VSEKAPQFFMLECFEPDEWDDSALVRLLDQLPSGTTWTDGRPFTFPVPEPVHFVMRAGHNDQMKELHNAQGLLMTRRLYDALRAAGVDNLDVYRAHVMHEALGTQRDDYVLANLVGVVAAADLAKSNVVHPGLSGNMVDMDFEGVAIDEERAEGLLMFRLAENVSAVVVHRRVRDALLAAGFDTLSFVPPASWMG